MKTIPLRFQRAFTLIEIMIAITIFGLVVGAMYACWSAVARAARAGQIAAADAQRSRMALRAVSDALTTVQMYAANIRFYPFFADTSSDFATLSLVSRLPESFPGSGVFGDRHLRRITFTVEQDKNARKQLIMRQKPLLEATNADEEEYSIVLAKDVSVFMLEFWDPVRSDWAAEWLRTNLPPPMVRVTLATGNGTQSRLTPEDVATRVVLVSSIPIPYVFQVLPNQALPPGFNPGVGLPRQPGGGAPGAIR